MEPKIEQIRGRVEANIVYPGDSEELLQIIDTMITKLDSLDEQDAIHTEGWRYYFGWEN